MTLCPPGSCRAPGQTQPAFRVAFDFPAAQQRGQYPLAARELAGLDDEHAVRLVHKLDLALWEQPVLFRMAGGMVTWPLPVIFTQTLWLRLDAKVNRRPALSQRKPLARGT